MTEKPADPAEHDILLSSVEKHKARYLLWEQDGDVSVARRLGQIGVLGWIIVLPILAAIFAGRWLDERFHSGLSWTAPLLMAGAALGCWSAWKWIQSA